VAKAGDKPTPKSHTADKPYEWTPLLAALSRIKDSVGDFGWAEIDLRQDLVTGQVESALRYLASDDGTKQIRLLLQPRFWQHLEITAVGLAGPVLIKGTVEGQPLECGGAWAFFVRTASLNERYPAASAFQPLDVVQPARADQASPSPPGRKSGKEWIFDAFERRRDELLALPITEAGRRLAKDSETAAEKPIGPGHCTNVLRTFNAWPKKSRNSPKQRPK